MFFKKAWGLYLYAYAQVCKKEKTDKKKGERFIKSAKQKTVDCNPNAT